MNYKYAVLTIAMLASSSAFAEHNELFDFFRIKFCDNGSNSSSVTRATTATSNAATPKAAVNSASAKKLVALANTINPLGGRSVRNPQRGPNISIGI